MLGKDSWEVLLMKKDCIKVCLMSLIGFFVALILHPFLHEAGHSIATILLGGQCVEFHLLPLPYMVCNAAGIGNIALVIIGLSGYILPFLLAVVIRRKFFYIWYGRLILRGISILSFVISAAVVLLGWCGITVPNDDITQILSLWNSGAVWLLIGALVSVIFLVTITAKEKPFRRIAKAFG